MANTTLSAQEFIRYALAPRVLVCASDDCQLIFRRSGMSLADALRPFATVSGNGKIINIFIYIYICLFKDIILPPSTI